MINRLYTFGCSFTSYYWPSWADILLSHFSGENWAKSGAGNKFIFESLVECHVTNQIKPDDCVIIMWTSFAREDRYIGNSWATCGNVYNAKPLYDQNFLDKYWSDKGCVLNNLNYISAAIEFLKSINCKWLMCHALPSMQFRDDTHMLLQNVPDIESFQKYFSFIYDHDSNFVSEPLFNKNYTVSRWKESSYGNDVSENHYFPIHHYDWLSRNLADRLDLDQDTKDNLLIFSKAEQERFEEIERIGKHPNLTNTIYDKNHPKNRI